MTKQLTYDVIAIAIFAVLARFAHPPVTLGGIFDAFWPWAIGAVLGWGILRWVFKTTNIWAQGATVWASAIIFGMILWALVNSSLPHYSFLIVAITMSATSLPECKEFWDMVAREPRGSCGRKSGGPTVAGLLTWGHAHHHRGCCSH